MLEEINKSIYLYEKGLSRSQSQNCIFLQPKFIQNPARNLPDLVAKQFLNISNNNNSLITSMPTKKKILLPKIKLVKKPDMNFLKNFTIDELLNKFNNNPSQDIGTDISNQTNKNKEFEFLFNNKNKLKFTRNKLNKVQFKKPISTIEEIKRLIVK